MYEGGGSGITNFLSPSNFFYAPELYTSNPTIDGGGEARVQSDSI